MSATKRAADNPRFTIRITPEQRDALKIRAVLQGTTVQEIFEGYVASELTGGASAISRFEDVRASLGMAGWQSDFCQCDTVRSSELDDGSSRAMSDNPEDHCDWCPVSLDDEIAGHIEEMRGETS